MTQETPEPVDANRYRQAGVDIEAGQALVEAIGPLARSTARPGATAVLGGFGALFDLHEAGFQQPLLVATTDGVGTKVQLLAQSGRHSVAGFDVVAMCVNDLLAQGAQPAVHARLFRDQQARPDRGAGGDRRASPRAAGRPAAR